MTGMDDLQARIAARLTEALRQQEAAGFESGADAGLALADHESGRTGVIRLSVDDVARIAAQVARDA